VGRPLAGLDAAAACAAVAPAIAPRGPWWEHLGRVLDWADAAARGGAVLGAGEPLLSVRAVCPLADGTVDLSRSALTARGLHPDAWSLPLTAAGVARENAAAAARAAEAARRAAAAPAAAAAPRARAALALFSQTRAAAVGGPVPVPVAVHAAFVTAHPAAAALAPGELAARLLLLFQDAVAVRPARGSAAANEYLARRQALLLAPGGALAPGWGYAPGAPPPPPAAELAALAEAELAHAAEEVRFLEETKRRLAAAEARAAGAEARLGVAEARAGAALKEAAAERAAAGAQRVKDRAARAAAGTAAAAERAAGEAAAAAAKRERDVAAERDEALRRVAAAAAARVAAEAEAHAERERAAAEAADLRARLAEAEGTAASTAATAAAEAADLRSRLAAAEAEAAAAAAAAAAAPPPPPAAAPPGSRLALPADAPHAAVAAAVEAYFLRDARVPRAAAALATFGAAVRGRDPAPAREWTRRHLAAQLGLPPVSWDNAAIALDAIDQAPEQMQQGMCRALRAQVALWATLFPAPEGGAEEAEPAAQHEAAE
jgi:hypothetical protein